MSTKFNLKLLFLLPLLTAVPLAAWHHATQHFRIQQSVMAQMPNGSNLGFAGSASWLAMPKQLRHIASVDLSKTTITDEALIKLIPKLHELAQLENINLSNTALSDNVIPHVGELRQLRRIDLRNTEVSPRAVEELRVRLPNVELLATEPVAVR